MQRNTMICRLGLLNKRSCNLSRACARMRCSSMTFERDIAANIHLLAELLTWSGYSPESACPEEGLKV